MANELCLILETSTERGSAALADMETGRVVEERFFESDRNHNARMFGPLEAMLGGGVALSVKRVLAGAGPGSYSGTRVGIAVAQGIAIAQGCPAVAIPSLVGVEEPGEASLAVGDARRGHWWWARMRGGRMETPEPELGDADALRREMEAATTTGRVIFSFGDPGAFGGDFAVRRKQPRASLLWQAWLDAGDVRRKAWAAAPPQPCYLKPPHITPPKRPWLRG